MNELSKRLRALVLDALELIASGNDQAAYQDEVPYVAIADELFNQWDDAYTAALDCREAFSDIEWDVLLVFNEAMSAVSASTPNKLPPIKVFMRTPEWQTMSTAARAALRSLADSAG
jgi:hypothetical protein